MEVTKVTSNKPRTGIMPRYIWDYKRLNNLLDAINRYIEANLEIPLEWIEEYNELIIRYEAKEGE